jgi:hypothetical protein
MNTVSPLESCVVIVRSVYIKMSLITISPSLAPSLPTSLFEAAKYILSGAAACNFLISTIFYSDFKGAQHFSGGIVPPPWLRAWSGATNQCFLVKQFFRYNSIPSNNCIKGYLRKLHLQMDFHLINGAPLTASYHVPL